jgi:xanthine dehydrogenase YagT iron-sulfur-binding subunit
MKRRKKRSAVDKPAPPPDQSADQPPETANDSDPGGIDRRTFVGVAAAAGVPFMLGGSATDLARALGRHEPPPTAVGPGPVSVTLMVNGTSHELFLEPRVTLLDALRESAGLTGTKKGCDHGQCGACTVHLDGRRVLSCLTLALQARGKQIRTVEGLAAANGALHPMQQAFIDHDAFQCGYCTPGQIMSAVALLTESCGTANDDVRECMSGNICRCGAYPNIVAAIQSVRLNQTG